MGQQARSFDATRAQLLANCSELLVRQLERRWALQRMQLQDAAALARPIACYDAAYLFVDAAGERWRVLHMNEPAIQQLGARLGARAAGQATRPPGGLPAGVASGRGCERHGAGAGSWVPILGGHHSSHPCAPCVCLAWKLRGNCRYPCPTT